MALRYFDELLRRLTQDELQAVDEIIAANDSFTVFDNLSRLARPMPSSLASKQISASDDFSRRGLAWVMALARIELGAIFATFTEHPYPFTVVKPSGFEMDAYQALLLDGVRTHYWALARDPALRKVSRTSPENPVVLSYSRRLKLVRRMLKATAKVGMGELNVLQYRELASWNKDLDALQMGLLVVIQSYLTTTASQNVVTDREFAEACGALLQAEQRELKKGTAVIIKMK